MLLGSAVVLALPARAHVVAELSVVSPVEGATVEESVDVIIAAAPGQTESADFTLLLDGRLVGRDGKVGATATFTSLSLKAGDRLTVPLRGLGTGKHTLIVRYAPDADSAKQDVVREFTVAGPAGTDRMVTIAVGVVVALVLAAAFVARRNAVRQP